MNETTLHPPATGGDGASTPLNAILEPVYAVRGWLKLLGVLMIISGVFQCLTCIGALIGWLPIWMGVLLIGAAKAAEQSHDRQDPAVFVTAQRKLALFVKIMGIMTLVTLVLMASAFILTLFVPALLPRLMEHMPAPMR